jgi:hypothetical protein
MPDEPIDPLTELAKGAAQLHEMFMAYVEAGFTRAEALQLVQGIIAMGIATTAAQRSADD